MRQPVLDAPLSSRSNFHCWLLWTASEMMSPKSGISSIGASQYLYSISAANISSALRGKMLFSHPCLLISRLCLVHQLECWYLVSVQRPRIDSLIAIVRLVQYLPQHVSVSSVVLEWLLSLTDRQKLANGQRLGNSSYWNPSNL